MLPPFLPVMRSVLGAPVTEANAAQQLLLLSSLGDFVKSEQSRVELLQHQARRAQRTASVRCATVMIAVSSTSAKPIVIVL